ncbi:hypothetical protein MMC31_004718 [Peltigera leucophlebia]|nr:hypothetical protein [Peltigera leucophlebia]
MDLVAGVRKEGSRGGRDAFKWEDVKDDQHRENYLGHSIMAPVGRWQKNKDLSWYAKGDDSQKAVDAANARADEIRRIKEAEQDALSEALGFKVEPRLREHQLAGPKEVERAIKEAAEGDEEGGKGLGFGGFVGAIAGGGEEAGERMMGYLVGEQGGREMNVNNKTTNMENPIKEIDQEKDIIIIIIAATVALHHAHAHDHDRGKERDGEMMMETLDVGEEERGAIQPQQHNKNQALINDDRRHIILGITGKEAILHNNEQTGRIDLLDHTEEKGAAPPSYQMRKDTIEIGDRQVIRRRRRVVGIGQEMIGVGFVESSG